MLLYRRNKVKSDEWAFSLSFYNRRLIIATTTAAVKRGRKASISGPKWSIVGSRRRRNILESLTLFPIFSPLLNVPTTVKSFFCSNGNIRRSSYKIQFAPGAGGKTWDDTFSVSRRKEKWVMKILRIKMTALCHDDRNCLRRLSRTKKAVHFTSVGGWVPFPHLLLEKKDSLRSNNGEQRTFHCSFCFRKRERDRKKERSSPKKVCRSGWSAVDILHVQWCADVAYAHLHPWEKRAINFLLVRLPFPFKYLSCTCM